MKDKATVCFRRMQSGKVIGVIINAAGKYKWILKFIELDNPDVGALPLIELTWN